MPLFRDNRELLKLERARAQPHLSFTPYSVVEILEGIRSELFPEIRKPVNIYFVNRGTLACIGDRGSSAAIYIHQVLNHNDTPLDVIRLICKHELLHLRIPSVVEGKNRQDHPPAFWAAEKAIAPERQRVWYWIWRNLSSCLKRRERLERIDVLPKWRQVWSQPRLDMATCERSPSAKPKETEKMVW